VIVVPAIDLRGGRCVRLAQGDYVRETVFAEDPVAMALHWQNAGARLLHVVDLDGARDGLPRQSETITAIVAALTIPVQVGGGIRSVDHAAALLEAGVRRVVIGTAAVERPELVDTLLAEYGAERVLVGVDARDGLVATHGWTTTSALPATDLIDDMVARGVDTVVYTDIERDGMLSAPNFAALERVAGRGAALVASGGVASRTHLEALARLPAVVEAIVGRALYTGDVVLHGDDWVIASDADAGGSVEALPR
jgi:phosphoribosylformimino-5-aminoimidazole carboxamide ribotide isomerase